MDSFTSENNILFTMTSGQAVMFTNIKDSELHILALEA